MCATKTGFSKSGLQNTNEYIFAIQALAAFIFTLKDLSFSLFEVVTRLYQFQ